MMEKNVCLCRLVSGKACSFTVVCQKKCHKNNNKMKERKRHLDRLISQVQVLSVLYPKVPCTTVC